MKVSLRTLLGGAVGNIVEWYDFAVYGFTASIIAPLFFPAASHDAALIATFGAFAAGFLMRPIGSLLYGYFGDKYGRKTPLVFSVILMGLPTTVLGLVPTFKTIGLWAPVILIVVRLLQGLSVGGEYAGSAAFMTEHAGAGRRGLYGSIASTAVIIGMLLASGLGAILSACLTHQQLSAWGWRIPFLLGIVVAYTGYIMRRKMSESPVYQEIKSKHETSKSPVIDAFKLESASILKSIGIVWMSAVGIYTLFIFMPTYLTKYLHYSLHDALMFSTINMVTFGVFTIIMGVVCDKVGRKRLQIIACILLILFLWPLYLLMVRHNIASLLIAQFLMTVIISIFVGPLMTILAELFRTKVRYTAMSIGYNVGFAVFGGTAPLVATALIMYFNSVIAPCFYIIFSAIITLITLMFVKESAFDKLR